MIYYRVDKKVRTITGYVKHEIRRYVRHNWCWGSVEEKVGMCLEVLTTIVIIPVLVLFILLSL